MNSHFKNLSKKSLDTNGFKGKVYEMFKEIRLILHNVFQKKKKGKKEETLNKKTTHRYAL